MFASVPYVRASAVTGGAGGLAAMDHVEPLSVDLGAVVGQRHQPGIEAAHDVVDRVVAGDRPPLPWRHSHNPAVDRGDGRRRCAQRQALDQGDQVGRKGPLPAIGAPLPGDPARP